MTDKDKLYDILDKFFVVDGKEHHLNDLRDELWSYFQSKQQEKIERVKGLKGIVKAIDFKGHTAEFIKKSDVLKIMEEK